VITRVELNRPNIRGLKFDHDVLDQIEEIAAVVLETVREIAPKRLWHYHNSLFMEMRRGATPMAIVGATDFKTWWIEFGAYGRIPPFRARAPLRRALTANGLDYIQLVKR
jgi:hypothetical protein